MEEEFLQTIWQFVCSYFVKEIREYMREIVQLINLSKLHCAFCFEIEQYLTTYKYFLFNKAKFAQIFAFTISG